MRSHKTGWGITVYDDDNHSWKVKWAPESLPMAWEIFVDGEFKTLAIHENEIGKILERYGATTEIVAEIIKNVPWGR